MEQTLTIKKVIAGGKGLGLLANGMVVMVGGVLPSETVTVREAKTHRGFQEASLVRIEQAAAERVDPPCPYYGRCGGCNLQHASSSAQLLLKQQILRESLERAHLPLPPDEPGPTLASPLPFAYRSRLRLHLDRDGSLGFHEHASNRVVPIERCLLAVDPINRVLGRLNESDWPRRLAGRIAAMELIHSPADDRVALVLQPSHSQRRPLPLDLIEAMRPLADLVLPTSSISGQALNIGVPDIFSQEFTLHGLGYRLTWDHRCFFQVNNQQNNQLVALALDLLSPQPRPMATLDLFCGMGNFSIPLALSGATVTGVEHNRSSIHWAQANSRANGLTTTRFVAADVEHQIKTLIASKAHFDCVLLDPPRQGLGKAAALLPQLQPELILSISCDPATLARDLALIGQGGYRLRRLIPVDMFPQTHHIESVALLERN